MPIQVREVTDAQGRVWRLYERQNTGAGISAKPHCLIAETQDLIRRFERYPDDWYAMKDSALRELVNAPARRRTDSTEFRDPGLSDDLDRLARRI